MSSSRSKLDGNKNSTNLLTTQIVGAGAAGLLMAYKMKKLFSNFELTCYEKYDCSMMLPVRWLTKRSGTLQWQELGMRIDILVSVMHVKIP